MLFDTHTHLDQAEFDANRAEVLARAHLLGVTHVVAVGCTAEASQKCVDLARLHENVYAAVGIQPNYVAEGRPEDWSAIEKLASSPSVVAVGETGLDRHWDFTPFDQQQDYFDRHIRLAERLNLPFVVHMRDCDRDIMEMLRAARKRGLLKGIMHSFTGDAIMAAECVELGMHISFAGMITYKNAKPLRDCARTIPDDRLLLETDCPYLSPEPVRKVKPNEPSHLRHTAERVAELRGVSLEQLAATTSGNARQLFGVV
ncbi:MAG: TatD family hydrolase [Pirellulales bacterium]|nr:TatD family hydrolase [Pirellulales bacterium]